MTNFAFFLHSDESQFLLFLLLLITQLMAKQFTDYWLFGSFPVFFITKMCDCHLHTVEFFLAIGFMTFFFRLYDLFFF